MIKEEFNLKSFGFLCDLCVLSVNSVLTFLLVKFSAE
jgi:hypothetical protein